MRNQAPPSILMLATILLLSSVWATRAQSISEHAAGAHNKLHLKHLDCQGQASSSGTSIHDAAVISLALDIDPLKRRFRISSYEATSDITGNHFILGVMDQIDTMRWFDIAKVTQEQYALVNTEEDVSSGHISAHIDVNRFTPTIIYKGYVVAECTTVPYCVEEYNSKLRCRVSDRYLDEQNQMF